MILCVPVLTTLGYNFSSINLKKAIKTFPSIGESQYFDNLKVSGYGNDFQGQQICHSRAATLSRPFLSLGQLFLKRRGANSFLLEFTSFFIFLKNNIL